MSKKLRAIVPMEWFPQITEILTEQIQIIANAGGDPDDEMEQYVATLESKLWSPHAKDTLYRKVRTDVVMREVAVLAAHLNLQSELFSKTVITAQSLRSMRKSFFRRRGGGGEFLRNLLLHNVQAH